MKVVNVNTQSTISTLQGINLYRGIQSRIARKLGVSRQFVSLVMQGKRTSRLVEGALRKEIDRIDSRRLAA